MMAFHGRLAEGLMAAGAASGVATFKTERILFVRNPSSGLRRLLCRSHQRNQGNSGQGTRRSRFSPRVDQWLS
jgi:hypothetical protein